MSCLALYRSLYGIDPLVSDGYARMLLVDAMAERRIFTEAAEPAKVAMGSSAGPWKDSPTPSTSR